MGSEAPQLHVFFFPFMAHGHMIPITDIARLFAARGTKSTIITTPLNASLFTETINRDRQSGLNIGVQIIHFPWQEVGLPEGCESADHITSLEILVNFLKASLMLKEPFEKLLEEHHPDCVVADMFLPWTTEIANKNGIPRLVFHGVSDFSLCVTENLKRYTPYKNITSDSEIFVVPGLPDQIEMTKSQLPNHVLSPNALSDMLDQVKETELKSFGVLMNSFYELEPAYVEYYKKVMGRKVWNIGPVSLYNRTIVDKAQRGKKTSVDEHYYQSWLDSKKPNSVLYICFGSISIFSTDQLLEIAMGLEASQIPFIWVVRMSQDKKKEQFLPEGFEQRMEGKGMVITDWAPQVLILDHPAVGGFMTHCGWNSILEGTSAGVPMITWPLFAEQFYNEKLVTQVLKTGISIGNNVWSLWPEHDNVSVTKERVEGVVSQLMGDGEEAEILRKRAKKLGEMAKKAVEEGGSSFIELTALIEELRVHSQQSKYIKH